MAVGDKAREAMGLARTDAAELTPLERRIQYTRSLAPAFADAVASGVKPETLIRDGITALRQTPDLVKCEAGTFAGALMSAAQLGLRPNVPSLGHGWVLPFWSGKRQRHEAQWVLGYQGMIELGYRSGLVVKVTTDTIRLSDHYIVRRGTADELVHEYDAGLSDDERGEAVAHYAIVWLQTGQPLWKAMSDASVRKIMERFAARDRNKNIVGPWRDDYEQMAQKTPLRALWRFMPKTEILSLALATDGAVRQLDQGSPAEPVRVTLLRGGDEPDGATAEPAPGEQESDAEPAAEGKPDEPASVDDSDADTHPQVWSTDVGAFPLLNTTPTRRAYIERIREQHDGDVAVIAETIRDVMGAVVPLEYVPTDKLRGLAHVSDD